MEAPPPGNSTSSELTTLPAHLRPHYSAFLEPGRVLLTGHSHQAWPDVARAAMIEAFDDAAAHADDKWSRAMDKADRVRRGVAERIGAVPEEIALAASTHELVARFLSALDLRARPHLVTTSGEFHSAHRQLSRLREEGVDVTFVDAHPVRTLAERLAAAITPKTAAVLASTVLFETSSVVPNLRAVAERAHAAGAHVLFDAYHAFGVVPFRMEDFGGGPVFLVAGGYKYAQWGEGVCFLRAPSGTGLRPVYTGWFSDFAGLAAPRPTDPQRAAPVQYGPRPADVFAGSTYDPVSHYRAAAVLDFFEREGLTVARLRDLSLAQTSLLLRGLDAFDVATPREPAQRGGFVSVRMPAAQRAVAALKGKGVVTDARGDLLRLGPAPYVTETELAIAIEALRLLA
jgi:kynureninase